MPRYALRRAGVRPLGFTSLVIVTILAGRHRERRSEPGHLPHVHVVRILPERIENRTVDTHVQTPTFFAAKSGDTLQPLNIKSLTADAFRPKLDAPSK